MSYKIFDFSNPMNTKVDQCTTLNEALHNFLTRCTKCIEKNKTGENFHLWIDSNAPKGYRNMPTLTRDDGLLEDPLIWITNNPE